MFFWCVQGPIGLERSQHHHVEPTNRLGCRMSNAHQTAIGLCTSLTDRHNVLLPGVCCVCVAGKAGRCENFCCSPPQLYCSLHDTNPASPLCHQRLLAAERLGKPGRHLTEGKTGNRPGTGGSLVSRKQVTDPLRHFRPPWVPEMVAEGEKQGPVPQ